LDITIHDVQYLQTVRRVRDIGGIAGEFKGTMFTRMLWWTEIVTYVTPPLPGLPM